MALADVLQFSQMGETLTIRLPPDLAAWLARTAEETGRSQGEIIRQQLERARGETTSPVRGFMRLAGSMRGAKDLSTRKGFSRS